MFGKDSLNNHSFTCRFCGASLSEAKEIKKGVVLCSYCGKVNAVTDINLNDWDFRLNSAIQLRNEYNFDDAERVLTAAITDAKDALEKAKNDKEKELLQGYLADYYYQRALVSYCVSHVNAATFHKQGNQISQEWLDTPTLATLETRPFSDSPDYLSALSYVQNNEEEQKYYKKKALEIDELVDWSSRLLKNVEPYNVFLSYKSGDDRSYLMAQTLYRALKKEGFRVFWAAKEAECIKEGIPFEPQIFQALFTSRVFLLVCSGNKGWFNGDDGRWIYNEWNRYLKRMSASENLLFYSVLDKGFSVSDLPSPLQKIQCFIPEKNDSYLKKIIEEVRVLYGRSSFHLNQVMTNKVQSLNIKQVEVHESSSFASRQSIIHEEADKNAVMRAKENLSLYAQTTRVSRKKVYLKRAFDALIDVPEEKKDEETYFLLFECSFLLYGINDASLDFLQSLLASAYAKRTPAQALQKNSPYFTRLIPILTAFLTEGSNIYGFPRSMSYKEMVSLYRFLSGIPGVNPNNVSLKEYPSSFYAQISNRLFDLFFNECEKEKNPTFTAQLAKESLTLLYPHFARIGAKEIIDTFNKAARYFVLIYEKTKNKEFFFLAQDCLNFILKGKCSFLENDVPFLENEPEALWLSSLLAKGETKPNYLNDIHTLIPIMEKMLQAGYSLVDGERDNVFYQAFEASYNGLMKGKTKKKAITLFEALYQIMPESHDYQSVGLALQEERTLNFCERLIALKEFASAKVFLHALLERGYLQGEVVARISGLLLLANKKINCYEMLIRYRGDLSSDEACAISGDRNHALLLYNQVETLQMQGGKKLRILRKIASISSKNAKKEGKINSFSRVDTLWHYSLDSLKTALSFAQKRTKTHSRKAIREERKRNRDASKRDDAIKNRVAPKKSSSGTSSKKRKRKHPSLKAFFKGILPYYIESLLLSLFLLGYMFIGGDTKIIHIAGPSIFGLLIVVNLIRIWVSGYQKRRLWKSVYQSILLGFLWLFSSFTYYAFNPGELLLGMAPFLPHFMLFVLTFIHVIVFAIVPYQKAYKFSTNVYEVSFSGVLKGVSFLLSFLFFVSFIAFYILFYFPNIYLFLL